MGWWLAVGGWWFVGWWLAVGGWRLEVGDRWLVIGGWSKKKRTSGTGVTELSFSASAPNITAFDAILWLGFNFLASPKNAFTKKNTEDDTSRHYTLLSLL